MKESNLGFQTWLIFILRTFLPFKANDMTVESTVCKLAYLLGREDLTLEEVRDLMGVNLRGEVTPSSELPLPPLSSVYQQAIQKQQSIQKQQAMAKNARGAAPY